MVIRKKQISSKIEIDLAGPQGNAYFILGQAKELCRALGKDYKEISERMKSGDYENLISVFDEEFGEYVILHR